MADYIEREALLTKIAKGTIITDNAYGMGIMAGVDAVTRMVLAQPAADVAPVVHGRWIRTEDGDWECSNCKDSVVICVCGKDVTKKKQYCPNCGAKMDLKET